MAREVSFFAVSVVAEMSGKTTSAIYQQWPGRFPTSYKSGSIHMVSRQDTIDYIGVGGEMTVKHYEAKLAEVE